MVVALVVWIIVIANQKPGGPATGGGAEVIRPNSHVLDQGGEGAVTVVEFLDFECESCGAFHPVVEDLRERYAGEITYVLRYFPIPSHFNSMNAAVAAEAAAQQGRLEEMYQRLFQTQSEWGEAQESRAELFRAFAIDLGLDIAQYDAAVADPATQARVQEDFDEGRLLGVEGTPTFFIDGQKLEIQRLTDVGDAIDRALSGATR
jgi:protein-disulfide isomerase